MKWILGLLALCLVGTGLTQAGFFRHRRSSACGDCTPAVQTAPSGCTGAQMERGRLFRRRGCGG